MEPVQLFQIAAKRNDWLSFRQSVVAQNLANANTPGFKARDAESFSSSLEAAGLDIARTSGRHLSYGTSSSAPPESHDAKSWATVHSGNTVSIEQELLKANEIRSAYSLNAGIVKAFHRMILASAKG